MNILLFIPFGEKIYGGAIAKYLRNQGNSVQVYDERPSLTFISRILYRYSSFYSRRSMRIYIDKIVLSNRDNNFDRILVIRGETFTSDNIELLKHYFPSAKTYLYLWDSINYTNTRNILQCFDEVFTFDDSDASTFGLKFRPLFFIPVYEEVVNEHNRKKLLFVGKIHGDRLKILQMMRAQFENTGYSLDIYAFLPSQFHYFFYYLTKPEFRRESKSFFKFKMISAEEIVDRLNNSIAVIDVEHIDQKGLTMRSIETFGANRKLVTTNIQVKNYDFYDKSRVLVVDRDHPLIDLRFLQTPIKPISPETLYNYSLSAFLREVLSL